jgi:hypothetical protein
MMSENIRMFRTATGEDVIAEYVETTELGDVYKNPVQLIAVPPRENSNQQNIGFAPFPAFNKPLSDIKITFNPDRIVFYIEIDQEFLEQYNTIFGHITTPSPKFILGK